MTWLWQWLEFCLIDFNPRSYFLSLPAWLIQRIMLGVLWLFLCHLARWYDLGAEQLLHVWAAQVALMSWELVQFKISSCLLTRCHLISVNTKPFIGYLIRIPNWTVLIVDSVVVNSFDKRKPTVILKYHSISAITNQFSVTKSLRIWQFLSQYQMPYYLSNGQHPRSHLI